MYLCPLNSCIGAALVTLVGCFHTNYNLQYRMCFIVFIDYCAYTDYHLSLTDISLLFVSVVIFLRNTPSNEIVFTKDKMWIAWISFLKEVFSVQSVCFCPCRTGNFHQFVKIALTKNPKKRPSADKLLQVIKLCHDDDDVVIFSHSVDLKMFLKRSCSNCTVPNKAVVLNSWHQCYVLIQSLQRLQI